MKKVYKAIINGFCGLGMANGIYAIYHTNPPYKPPRALTPQEAWAVDGAALAGDWQNVCDAISAAYAAEAGQVHAKA